MNLLILITLIFCLNFEDYNTLFLPRATATPLESRSRSSKILSTTSKAAGMHIQQQVGQEELLRWTSAHPCRSRPMLGHAFWGSLALLIISSFLQDAPHLPSIPDRDELESAAARHACNDASLGLVGSCCDWPMDWMQGACSVSVKRMVL